MLSDRFTETCSLTRIALVCAIGATITFAVPSIGVADDSTSHAEQLFAEGRDHFQDGEYEEAADYFLQAYDILDVPELLYNIGQAYRRAGDLVAAEKYFQKYLSETTNPPNEDQVAETIIELQQQLAAQKAMLNIDSTPSGVTVSIDDGEHRCDTPCSVELLPGTYTLNAHKEGYKSATRRIEMEPDTDQNTSLVLAQDVVYGQLHIRTDVDDAVAVADGNSYSLPTTDAIELQQGEHTIAVQWQGERLEHRVDIDGDQPLRLFIPLQQAGSGEFSLFQASAIGLGGVSAALAVAATFTGLQTRATHDDLQVQQDTFGAVSPELVASGQRQRAVTNGLWAGAVTSLLAGAGLWTWEWMNSSSGDEQLEPTEVDEPDQSDTDSADIDADVDML